MRLFRAGAVSIMVVVILCARQWYPSSFANIALSGWVMMVISYLSIGVIALIAETRNKEKNGLRIIFFNPNDMIQLATLWLPFYTAMLIHDFGNKKKK